MANSFIACFAAEEFAIELPNERRKTLPCQHANLFLFDIAQNERTKIFVRSEISEEAQDGGNGNFTFFFEDDIGNRPLRTDKIVYKKMHGIFKPALKFVARDGKIHHQQRINLSLHTLDFRAIVVKPALFAVFLEFFSKEEFRIATEKCLDSVGDICGEDILYNDRVCIRDAVRDAIARRANDSLYFLIEHERGSYYFVIVFTRSISFFAADLNVASIPVRSTICWYISTAESNLDIFS